MASPSRARRIGRVLFWCGAAVVVPLVAAFAQRALANTLPARSEALGWVGTGSLAGAMFGLLLGVRSGRLSGWAFGPPVGFLAGVLDVKLFEFLFGRGYLPLPYASLLPVWSVVLGAFAAWPRRRTGAILAVVAVAAVAQASGQGAWYLCATRFNSSLQLWLGALTFSPPALVLLLFGLAAAAPAPVPKPGTDQVLGTSPVPHPTN